MPMPMISINTVEFVKMTFDRIFPVARVVIHYDLSKSLEATIEVTNGDYPPCNLDLALFLNRYERHGIERGDQQTIAELLALKTMPVAPSVSTGPGKVTPAFPDRPAPRERRKSRR